MAKLQIKLVRSQAGRLEKHRKTLVALGLHKVGDVVEHNDTPAVRGQIRHVAYLVEVEEI